MPVMNVRFEKALDDGVQVGSEPCGCGSCHPTATVYRDDPLYERHDPRLAEGPCCCGRYFALGDTEARAGERAEAMAAERRAEGVAPSGYEFHIQHVPLPWGAEVVAVIGDPRG